MKNLTKKLFLSIITILLTLATFASVTYAWMSLNSEAWVEGMEFQATGGEGFLISVDDNNYKSNLTKSDIIKAIVKKYNSEYVFDENGDLIDRYHNIINDYEEIMANNIKLLPLTSYGSDYMVLTNLAGSLIDISEGQYIEFDIYFKASSQIRNDVTIYLNGSDRVLHSDGIDYQVPKTSVLAAKSDTITLSSMLTTYLKESNDPTKIGEAIIKNAGDEITVNSHNALRLGISNEEEDIRTIVEIADELDLGSYATNISDYTTSSNPLYDANIGYEAKYDATKNAMFTYYNGLKNVSLTAIDYKKMPKTITNLVDNDGNNVVNICTLTSFKDTAKATFKLWLEGWDADSIEGIAKAITVRLSFAQ